MRRHSFVLFVCLLGFGCSIAKGAEPPAATGNPVQPATRSVRELEGWSVHVDDRQATDWAFQPIDKPGPE